MLCQYLKEVAAERGITHEMIAERTGFQRANVSRMLAGKYSPTLDNFLTLCQAIGVYVFIIDKTDDSPLAETMRKRWDRPGQVN